MRRLLLIPIVTISLSAMEINFKKSFELEIKPNTLQANINISVKMPSEKNVLTKLSHYNDYFDSAEDIEKKGGNYNVHPEYSYENNHRYKSGYIGNMHYQISSKESDKINKFITGLYNQKSDKSVDISTSSVTWIMNKEQKSGKIDALRFDAIQWSVTYAKSLSDKLLKSCKVMNISFDNIQHNYPRSVMRNYKEEGVMMDSMVQSAPTPTQDIQKISINPSFRFECK